ncbi:site-specific integrase [bacterium]|nr:MAG: site-specific integrase [bacterium]
MVRGVGFELRTNGEISRFTNFLGIPFDKPKYRPAEKLPFIPTEKEIDQLIAACGFRTSTFLTILKETGIRSGEAAKLTWNNIDFERKTIKIVPQKHGIARELKISETLIAMLKNLPKTSQLVFGAKVQTIRSNFAKQRKRIAMKLNNPRLNQLHFHSLRHWRATIEYQRTKSILQVQQMLGHRNIKNTMVYIHLINFEANSYISRMTRNAKGA